MVSLSTTAVSTPSDDQIIQLREWGTDRNHVLPSPPRQVLYVETPSLGPVRLIDRGTSFGAPELIYDRGQWHIRDPERTTVLRQDGEPRKEFALTPGLEIGIGATVLVAESQRSIALREFCARIIGWGGDRMRVVEHALRAIRLAAARRAPLVLRGEEDLVRLAHALHRRVLDSAAPFVVCDRRRRADLSASVRSLANHRSGVAALEAAAGGSLCVWSRRLPRDLPELLRLLDEPDRWVQLVVCTTSHARGRLLTSAMPIEVPPLGLREAELPQIVQAYADEAIVGLHASTSCFSEDDHDWVMRYSARSLSEIEKATLRIIALHRTDNVHQAAKLLGMSPVSLSRWLSRRMPLTDPGRLAGTHGAST